MWGISVSLTERSAALRLVVCAALAAAVAWSQSAETWTIDTIAGTGTEGYSGDGGAATAAQLNNPRGVAVDGSGNVYIADLSNNRIRKVDGSGNISTIAGTGTQGYSGDGGAATAARLNWPQQVAVDGTGNVYIADTGNQRIRKVDGAGNISTFAGTGTEGYSGDGGAATAARLNSPQEVALDNAGNVYIADTGNDRIRKVDGSGNISTFAGTGTEGYSGDGGRSDRGAAEQPQWRSGGRLGQRVYRRLEQPPHPQGGRIGQHLHLRGNGNERHQRGRGRGDRRAAALPPRGSGGRRGQRVHRRE